MAGVGGGVDQIRTESHYDEFLWVFKTLEQLQAQNRSSLDLSGLLLKTVFM